MHRRRLLAVTLALLAGACGAIGEEEAPQAATASPEASAAARQTPEASGAPGSETPAAATASSLATSEDPPAAGMSPISDAEALELMRSLGGEQAVPSARDALERIFAAADQRFVAVLVEVMWARGTGLIPEGPLPRNMRRP